ncbi:MAG: superoxide dismutase [Patescibacteria group bacterium]
MKYTLPELTYAYDALEPAIDARTMEIHHSKHHQGYIDNLNRLLEEHSVVDIGMEKLLANISAYPVGIRNNAGGHYNHSFFWESLTPQASEMPSKLETRITETFGSIDAFKEKFTQVALGRFGSGWAWLGYASSGELKIFSTANQDNPLMDVVREQEGAFTPLLGIDVWEHAYYLKYQNQRAQYLDAHWQIIDWGKVAERMG